MVNNEYAVGAAKSAPPVFVSGLAIAEAHLNSIVLVATLVYTLLQIALLIRKYLKDRKNGS